jgi:hypothetical protein
VGFQKGQAEQEEKSEKDGYHGRSSTGSTGRETFSVPHVEEPCAVTYAF